jgi:hypothetical protein
MPYFSSHSIDRFQERVRCSSRHQALEQMRGMFDASTYSHETRDRGKIHKAGSLCFLLVGDSVLSVWME